jgi:chromosome segregation ATPase
LKNTLNDDNKKSQVQISKMKKNYEDLQRIIDSLNMKHVKASSEVARLKENFINDDMERINEIFAKCDDKLNDCDRNINGEKTQME